MKRKLLASLLAIVMVIGMLPATVLAADFSDTNGHWGKAAIDRWADVGILNGKGDGNFDPNGSMTRAEFAQMLATMMGYTTRVANTFSDVPAGAWYEDAMLKLVAAGVLSGNGDGTATPNDPITREQAAVLLCRAFNLEPSRNASLNYQDSASISSWARDAMAALAERGMMSGVGDNTAAPQLNINRASVATLADNMIAEYVTESKTITGRVDGIILVAGGASVNLDNATVSEPVIIAPKASGVSVNLTGSTTADDIVIEANSARVSVGANASASSVKAESNSASVSVAGTVSSVDVTGTNGRVTVTGSVGTVSTEAPGTSITVSGTVSNVDIGENASRASVTASAGGKIDSVTTEASNVTVSGNGTVGSVTATGGSVDVTTKGTEVKNDGANKVTAGDKTVASGKTETSTGASSSGGDDDNGGSGNGTITPDNPGPGPATTEAMPAGLVVVAPLEDHATNPIDNSEDALGTVNISNDSKNIGEEVYNFTITGTNIMLHKADGTGTGPDEDGNDHWLGFGIEIEVEAEPEEEGEDPTPAYEYTYTIGTDDVTDISGTAASRYYQPEGSTKWYNTIYLETSDYEDDGTCVVTQTATDPETEEEVTRTFNITVVLNKWSGADHVELGGDITGATNTDLASGKDDYSLEALFDTDADIDGTTITLTDTTISRDALDEDSVYYLLTVDDENIEKIKGTTDTLGGTSAIEIGEGVAVKVDLSGSLAEPIEQEFELLDEDGRTQDIVTVTIDATLLRFDGETVVNFYDEDDQIIAAESRSMDVKDGITMPAISGPNKDDLFYTGYWTYMDEGETKRVKAGETLEEPNIPEVDPIEFKIEAIPVQTSNTIGERPNTGYNDVVTGEELFDFHYQDAYHDAGLSFNGGILSLDKNDLADYVLGELDSETRTPPVVGTAVCIEGQPEATANHEENYRHLLNGTYGGSSISEASGKPLLLYGIQYMKPATAAAATKLMIVDVLGEQQEDDLDEWYEFTLDEGESIDLPDNQTNQNQNVYDSNYIKYFPMAVIDDDTNATAIYYPSDAVSAGVLVSAYCVWLDDDGVVLGVSRVKIERDNYAWTPMEGHGEAGNTNADIYGVDPTN